MRIGITKIRGIRKPDSCLNKGEAYFDGLGSSEHRKTTTVYGTVINLAARFMGAAGIDR